MSNIKITAGQHFFEIDFGDYKEQTGIRSVKIQYKRDSIESVRCHSNELECTIRVGGANYSFSFDDNGANIVDEIEGSAPTSNADLYTKLKTLMVK